MSGYASSDANEISAVPFTVVKFRLERTLHVLFGSSGSVSLPKNVQMPDCDTGLANLKTSLCTQGHMVFLRRKLPDANTYTFAIGFPSSHDFSFSAIEEVIPDPEG